MLQPPSVNLLIVWHMKYTQQGQGLYLLTELLLGLAMLQRRRFARGALLLRALVRCTQLLPRARVFCKRSAWCQWEHMERVSAAGGRHKGLQPVVVEPKQGLGSAKSKVQLLFELLAPAFTPRTAQGLPRDKLPREPRLQCRQAEWGCGSRCFGTALPVRVSEGNAPLGVLSEAI